jgi:hypothetical protein
VYYRPDPALNYAGVPFPPYNNRELDINQDGVIDFAVRADPAFSTIAIFNNNRLASLPEERPDTGTFVFPFAVGSQIGSSLNPVLVWERAGDYPGESLLVGNFGTGSAIGLWPGVNAYVGIELEISGLPHYGWIHIASDSFSSGSILDWAYETRAGVAIEAGAGVPEPSSLALLGLAAGLFCFFRQRAAKPPPLIINQIVQTATNQIAIGWPAVVGQLYQVQSLNALGTTNWANVDGTR